MKANGKSKIPTPRGDRTLDLGLRKSTRYPLRYGGTRLDRLRLHFFGSFLQVAESFLVSDRGRSLAALFFSLHAISHACVAIPCSIARSWPYALRPTPLSRHTLCQCTRGGRFPPPTPPLPTTRKAAGLHRVSQDFIQSFVHLREPALQKGPCPLFGMRARATKTPKHTHDNPPPPRSEELLGPHVRKERALAYSVAPTPRVSLPDRARATSARTSRSSSASSSAVSRSASLEEMAPERERCDTPARALSWG